MLKKLLAAFLAVALIALSVAPVAEAQSYRHPRARGDYYTGSPLQRVVRGNMSMVDGLFGEIGYGPMAGGYGYGGYGMPYQYNRYGRNRGWYGGYGYDTPYSYYDGYDYYYGNSGWRYRRHNTRETLQTVGTVGAVVLGIWALSKASKAEKKAETAAAPPAAQATYPPAQVEPVAIPTCVATRIVNRTGSPAFVGELGGRGIFLQIGQATDACLTPLDCAYKQVENSLVPAEVTRERDAVVIH